jgi:peroxin-5
MSGVSHLSTAHTQFPEAIAAFEAALKLRPEDYSLWNKLGATLANNARR